MKARKQKQAVARSRAKTRDAAQRLSQAIDARRGLKAGDERDSGNRAEGGLPPHGPSAPKLAYLMASYD